VKAADDNIFFYFPIFFFSFEAIFLSASAARTQDWRPQTTLVQKNLSKPKKTKKILQTFILDKTLVVFTTLDAKGSEFDNVIRRAMLQC
jgi:hypothetical protein